MARTAAHLATRPTVPFLQLLPLRERVWFARDMVAMSRIKRLELRMWWLTGEPERCLNLHGALPLLLILYSCLATAHLPCSPGCYVKREIVHYYASELQVRVNSFRSNVLHLRSLCCCWTGITAVTEAH